VRLALAFLFLFLGGAAAADASPAVIRGADPERYSLDLRYLSKGAGVLKGSERIDFVNRGPAPLASVWLRLWADGPDRCHPRRISVKLAAPAQEGTASCTVLEARLPAAVAPGAAGSLSLTFTVHVRKADDRFGHVGKIALLGNVIPVLTVEDDRGLHLERYTPNGESFYTLAARWDAHLRLPARLRAASTGAVLSERVRGGQRTLHVGTAEARDFGLAIGPLRVTSTKVRGIRIRGFARKGTRGIRSSLRAARSTVDYLSGRMARYGGRELDLVLLGGGVGGFGGMEYPELVFTTTIPFVVSHEVAHQWWYGIVGDDQYAEPWLDEGFATYVEGTIFDEFQDCDSRRPFGVVPPRFRHFQVDEPMSVWDRAPIAYGWVVYTGGACALRTLERDIGRQRATTFFRLLQTRFRFGIMRTSDVIDAIREVAPGYDVAGWEKRVHIGSS
jgi:hypothetical protein